MLDRRQILQHRIHVQQLDRAHGTVADTAILDLGVQDTGPDGGRWALTIRGTEFADEDLVLLWTVRGAPHYYRRADVGQIAAAVEPYSDADAGKRIFDAARPLKAAGIANLDALDEVAAKMRAIVTKPTVKGEMSGKLAQQVSEPYLRFCRSCNATHLYEMPFRLGAVRAGLELQPDTSPPVLQRIAGFKKATRVTDRFDLIRAYLRLLGPATHKQVADYIDAPVKDVKAHWPEHALEVKVDGETRWMLGELTAQQSKVTRLLGPFDLFLQAKDRDTLVTDADRAKQLWPVLGRPGAVLSDGELIGVWRPRKSGKTFTVAVEPWSNLSAAKREAIEEQASRLADYRGIKLSGVDFG